MPPVDFSRLRIGWVTQSPLAIKEAKAANTWISSLCGGGYKGKEDWESVLGEPTCSIFHKGEYEEKVKNNRHLLQIAN